VKKTLSVVEGKWSRDTHVSIRDLFSPLFELWGGGGTDYHYEMFSTVDSLRIAIDYAFQPNQADTVYLATHGTAKELYAYHDGHRISRSELANSIEKARGTTKRGLHIGSCLFGSEDNATWLLEKLPRVSWIAGYSSSIDWIDSSALDLFWLRHLLFATPGKGKAKPETPMKKLDYAVERTRRLMPGLAQDLKFHVFTRKKGPAGGIEDLMA
jgi:hypothetical protein